MLLESHFPLDYWPNNSFGHFESYEGIEWVFAVWAAASMLCFAVGFPASAAILWEMFKTHRRGAPFTPYEFLILNVSTMDAVFLVFIPLGLLNSFIWKIDEIGAVWDGIYALSVCGRPLMMACICVDCYLAVVHPILYHKQKSLAPRVVVVGIVWALTVVNGIIYGLSDYSSFAIAIIVIFLVVVVIIVISDSFIVHTLIKSDSDRQNVHPQKQRAIQTLIYSLVIAVISYFPSVILSIVGKVLVSDREMFKYSIAIPTTITSTVGSAVMPLIYLHNTGKLGCSG